MKPIRALLVVLSICVNSLAQTSNGLTSLETKIAFGQDTLCTMTDLAVEFINDRSTVCTQGQAGFFNGERRSVNDGYGVYPLDGNHIQNGYELTSCACAQNGTWTRTMNLLTTDQSSFIHWTWKFYARKPDCSLELKRNLMDVGCWISSGEEKCECPEGTSNFLSGSDCDCPPITPVAIDLDGDGLRLTDRTNGVQFDLDSNGQRGLMPWLAEDGWLVLNHFENGMVYDGGQLFGDLSAQINHMGESANGYAALRVFDDNRDSLIDRHDGVWRLLGVWRDVNHNGVSESGEVRGLDQLGITALDLNYGESRRRDRHGNELRYRARVRWANGARTWSWDVLLSAD